MIYQILHRKINNEFHEPHEYKGWTQVRKDKQFYLYSGTRHVTILAWKTN